MTRHGAGGTAPHIHVIDLRFTRCFALIRSGAIRGRTMSDTVPPQRQDRQPGQQHQMDPRPRAEMADYRSAQRLASKAAS